MSNYSQSNNGQPLSKRPKLDIGRHINLSNSITRSKSTVGDMYDDLWGDDLDVAALEKVDLEETQALSQMPEIVRCSGNTPKQSQWIMPSESLLSRENYRAPQLTNKRLSINTTKISPRVPLRRTASSGWPSASTFCPSSQPSSMAANSSNRNVGDINLIQSNFNQLVLENKTMKEQLTRKTGEVNLIRDRLLSVQQECVKQKKGLSDQIEIIKGEADRNSVRFSKEIRSLRGQLEVKTMEMETAERRVQHMSSINRLNPDSPRSRGMIRPVFSPARAGTRQGQREDQLMCRHGHLRAKHYTCSLDLLKQLVTPELMKPSQPEPLIQSSTRIPYNPGLLLGQPSTSRENPPTSGCHLSTTDCNFKTSVGTLSRSLFYSATSNVEALPAVQGQLNVPCASLEPCSLSLLSPRLLDINSENAHQVISQVTESCAQILLELLHQVNVTSLSTQSHKIEELKELPQLRATDLTQTADLLCHKELYNNERGICARRALALQSLLVEFSSYAAELLLPSSTGKMPQKEGDNAYKAMTNLSRVVGPGSSSKLDSHQTLKVIQDIVQKIKVQRRAQIFEGVLAAVMALVRSLLQADVFISQQSQDLIVHILQGVVSSRPGSLVLYYILQVLLTAAKYPHVTASLCCNSDKCILQALCMLVQLSETPRKHILSDLFTSWVLSLFYGNGLSSPKWLFSVPSQSSCQCRPLVSRLCLTMLGEACSTFPTADNSEKVLLEKLLKRGVLLVSTLLYHDEHFGANVDPASEGHYELFIWSMNTFSETQEIKLNEASRDILESLSIQEGLRKPMYTTVGSESTRKECDIVLKSLLFDDIHHKDVLDYLDP